MADKPALSLNVQFQIGDADPDDEQFTTTARVVDIIGPAKKRPKLDVSAQDSENGVMEFITGMLDPGDLQLKCRAINDTTQQALESLLDSGAEFNARLVVPYRGGTRTRQFPAAVLDMNESYQLNNPMGVDFTIGLMGVTTEVV